MECKAQDTTKPFLAVLIRIVPEWNVKVGVYSEYPPQSNIRIVPEWNVKYIWLKWADLARVIRIVPEWSMIP